MQGCMLYSTVLLVAPATGTERAEEIWVETGSNDDSTHVAGSFDHVCLFIISLTV